MIKRLFTIVIISILLINFFRLILPQNVSAKNAFDIYKILVDVEESKMYIFKDDKIYKIYKCAGGRYETPSPIGTWKIVSKGRWGEGFGRTMDAD